MKKIQRLIVLLTITLGALTQACAQKEELKTSTSSHSSSDQQKADLVIAFGSCNKQYMAQPLWQDIAQNNPTLWVWLGDNIYGDTQNMELMKSKYDQQLRNQGYKKLMEKVKVIGTWDDHDYGVNDGGGEFPKKKESQQLMLDFLKYPANSPVRQQEGVYNSYTITKGGHAVKVILLDTRYFRGTLKRVNGVYQTNTTGTMLGKTQWQWLENELNNSQADVNIIGSSIQFIPEEHRFEKWANFPKERQRFLDLIAKTRAKNVVLISGDRHIAEVSKYEAGNLSYPLYEITSSGLTHTWGRKATEKNKYREGELMIALNFGILEFYFGESPKVVGHIKGRQNKVLQTVTIPLRK
ncbi:alkaline phosphatase D family protein [uncultured Microscilla sp.]|uniref:alkaline phosphatase D family protein n=1 Tax=uncultured Microscilla sp. TaxID=432653 RepID=UPI002614C102|nr:alkaline phosphatase D family protein [uncultured Microscilla sp.]